jgi:hypothetical protein
VNLVEWLDWDEATMATRHDFSDSSPGRRRTTAHTVVMVPSWWGFIALPAPRLQKVVIW